MAERRKFIRFDVLLDAFQLHEVGFGPPEKIKSYIKDIGRGGLRLATENLLPKGSFVNLEMTIPGDKFPILAFDNEVIWCRKAEVIWSRKAGESGYDTGMRFTDIKKKDKSRLLDYVYSEWRKFMKQKQI